MELTYSIDGRDFKEYGIYVSSSQGLIGGLKPKKCFTAEWPDENGSFPTWKQVVLKAGASF